MRRTGNLVIWDQSAAVLGRGRECFQIEGAMRYFY
jgi:hypothetical protein